MSLAAGARLGPYEIVSAIGAGGMGEVYRARDPRTGRDVAIKIASEQFNERFSREVHAVAALNHPNICTLYDVGPNYLVMELVDGQTLADRIGGGALPLDEALGVARQIADALDAAHEKGIVHRDLKPANIKVTPQGVVKVLDFGLAKAVGPAEAGHHDAAGPGPAKAGHHVREVRLQADLTNSPTLSMATQAGLILGTAAYMAPEQARGQAVDKRADIWAFGVILYELVTGRRLFEGVTTSDTLASVLKEDPSWDKVPVKVHALLRRCLEKDPKRRLRDIGDAMTLLAIAPESTPPRNSRLLWVATAALAAALSFALWAPWRAASPVPTPDVKRYQIPRKAAAAPFAEFAISPDGRFLAYMGSERGATHLWLHALDSLEAWAPPGVDTTNVAPAFPFWSPDSRYVAVATGNKLRKFSVTGGPPQTICDLTIRTNTAGAWNRDGVILIGSPDGLLRVSEAGGTTVPVMGLHKGGAFFPSFLPDGRHFLYTSSADEVTTEGIYVGSLDEDQGEAKPLVRTDGAAIFALDPLRPAGSSLGHLLFRRESALVAQPFDAARLTLMGEAVPVADQVGRFFIFPSYSVSSGGILVHHPGSPEAQGQLTWLDRQGRTTGTLSEPASLNEVRVSPDGTRVAATIFDSVASNDIWVIDASRGIRSRLTVGPGGSWSPIWSPDGREIAFFTADRQRGNRQVVQIYRRSADGAGEEALLLSLSSGDGHLSSWSPDGRHILYTQYSYSSQAPDVWVLPLGAEQKPFPVVSASAGESSGTFSPNGRWIAYISDETGANEIYVRPFPSSSGGKWLVSKGAATSSPVWRRDGRELFYAARDSSLMAVDVATGAVFRPGEPKALFKLPERSRFFAAAPDGTRFLVAVPEAEDSARRAVAPYTVVLNWTALLKR